MSQWSRWVQGPVAARQVAALLALLLARVLETLHGSGSGGRAGHHGTMFLAAHPWSGQETKVPVGDGGDLRQHSC